LDKFALSDSARGSILKEVSLLRKLDHPSLLKIYEIYEDESNVFMVFELFYGKDLKTKLNDYVCLDEKSISDILWKLLHGLHHMHSRNIFHRDIKLENIYFRNPNNLGDVCLSNFFISDNVEPYKGTSSKNIYKKVGTAGFIAPEIFT